MRTSRAWAIARADGSVEAGPLPIPPLATVPAARVLTGLTVAFKVSAQRGMRGRRGTSVSARRSRVVNRRFLAVIVAAEAAMLLVTTRIHPAGLPWWQGVLAISAPWVFTLFLIRVAAPAPLWRYHGAEHKAAAAFEAGVDLADVDAVMRVSRIHNRCGTNLVTLLAILGVLLNPLPVIAQIPLFAIGLGLAAEWLTIAATRPQALWSRVLLAGGRALQRYVTTAEPTRAEMAVACRSLLACVAEHERVVALERTDVATDADSAAPPSLVAA